MLSTLIFIDGTKSIAKFGSRGQIMSRHGLKMLFLFLRSLRRMPFSGRRS